VVGVLNLFCQVGTHAFDDEALQLAQVYADQAAVFIENARLVDELRLAAAELEARVEQRTRQLRESQSQVIRAEKMAAVGRLAGSVAHEINNPLQAIALHLQLVAEDGLSADGQEELDIVQDELARIAGIVSRLLDFQKPKHGRLTPQTSLTLLQEVLALSGKQLQQANVTVTCAAEEDLPPVMAMGDRLKQVFLNLVLNAVEAMPDGGRLDIYAARQNGRISITFSDSGAGIPPEVMPQLFEPFFSTKHSGTGLGLAVSQEIIAEHGGTLTAVSPAVNFQGNGRPGATFTVTLPIAELETAV
jgi:signal transduction histidine kinase